MPSTTGVSAINLDDPQDSHQTRLMKATRSGHTVAAAAHLEQNWAEASPRTLPLHRMAQALEGWVRRSLAAGGVLQHKVQKAWRQVLQGAACLQGPDRRLETLTHRSKCWQL